MCLIWRSAQTYPILSEPSVCMQAFTEKALFICSTSFCENKYGLYSRTDITQSTQQSRRSHGELSVFSMLIQASQELLGVL